MAVRLLTRVPRPPSTGVAVNHHCSTTKSLARSGCCQAGAGGSCRRNSRMFMAQEQQHQLARMTTTPACAVAKTSAEVGPRAFALSRLKIAARQGDDRVLIARIALVSVQAKPPTTPSLHAVHRSPSQGEMKPELTTTRTLCPPSGCMLPNCIY